MRVVKKVVAVVTASVLMASMLVGCGNTTEPTESNKPERTVDETAKKELTDAVANLQAKDKYVVNNQLSAPDGSANFLEAVHEGDTYTEYPVANDSEDSEAENTTTYDLQDWVTLDGKAYTFLNGTWYQYPEGYGDYVLSRKVLYADKMIPALTSLKKLDKTETADIGDGNETFTIYTGTIPAELASELLSVSTKKVYQTIVDKYKNDDKYKNEVHLAELYLQDLEKTMTVSEGDVEFAVKDGVLREVNLSVGGLGTKLKYFRAVTFKAQHPDQTKPSEVGSDTVASIIETMKEMADFGKDFETYNDMLAAYQEKTAKAQAEAEAAASGSAVAAEPTATPKEKKNKK